VKGQAANPILLPASAAAAAGQPWGQLHRSRHPPHAQIIPKFAMQFILNIMPTKLRHAVHAQYHAHLNVKFSLRL
jgi:hypothetical protein